MRRLAAAALTLALGACTGPAEDPAASPPPAPATTAAGLDAVPPTAATTTVLRPTWQLVLTLDPAEEAALGDGVRIAVTWDGGPEPGAGPVLESAGVELLVDGEGDLPAAISVAYLGADGAVTEPAWTQPVPAEPAPTVAVGQQWRGSRPPAAGGILLGWQAAGNTARYVRELDAAPGLTAASPVWWFLSEDGELTSTADPVLVDAAHDRGIAAWPAIASLDAARIHAAMADPVGLAEEVAAAAQAVGADGVNVDFEGYRRRDTAAVAEFVEALAAAVHEWGGVVSIDLTARSDTWEITPPELEFWSSAPDRRRLAAAVDYVVLMAYDQYNSYRPAGPVAGPAWVEETLRYLLRYVEPDRVVLGLPFYGRVWDPEDLASPRALGTGAMGDLAAGGERSFDGDFAVDRVDLADGRFLWVENSVERAPTLVERYGLAGIAGWRLGLDGPGVWDVLG